MRKCDGEIRVVLSEGMGEGCVCVCVCVCEVGEAVGTPSGSRGGDLSPLMHRQTL